MVDDVPAVVMVDDVLAVVMVDDVPEADLADDIPDVDVDDTEVDISPHVREPGIRNPTFFCFWNPESKALESGIQSLESGIQPVESGIQPHLQLWNPGLECTALLPSPFGVPYHHHHQKVFGHLTCTSNMATPRLDGLGTCFICLRSFS